MKLLLNKTLFKNTFDTPKISNVALSMPRRGFALIASISIMSLLLLVSIAMLSLSSVEIHHTDSTKDMTKARANARLALMMAIADLQLKAGPDTRVTAPANSVVGNNNAPSHLTGVWRSWEGNDHDKSTGLPIAPDYGSKLIKGELESNSTEEGRFLGWLISGSEKDNDADSPPALTESENTVPLLGEGSLGFGSIDSQVHIVPTEISEDGSIAYWIQGENTKALLNLDNKSTPIDDTEWSQRLASYGRADVESFGFDNIDDFNKVNSLKTLDLMSNITEDIISNINYHDVTTYSRGLLTNTANGGWRRDLSLMAEKWSDDDLAATGLPVLSLAPYETEQTSSLTLADNPSDGAIYPWATKSGISMSWNALMDYTSLYKKVKKNATSDEPYFDMVINNNSDWNSILPVCARMHWAFSYQAVENSDGTYKPQCILRPAITVWNPYNVAVESDQCKFQFRVRPSTFPINIYATVGSQAESKLDLTRLLSGNAQANVNQGRIVMNLGGNTDTTLKPGESRVFGSNSLSGADNKGADFFFTTPGYERTGGRTVDLSKLNTSIVDGAAGDAYSFSWDYNGDTNNDMTASLLYLLRPNGGLDYPGGGGFNGKTITHNAKISFATAAEKMPLPELVNDNETLKSAADDNEPFLVVSMGLRSILDEDTSDGVDKLHTKGYIDSKLFRTDQTISLGSTIEDSPYIWEFFSPNNDLDPFMPSTDEDKAFGNHHAGFIGTSFQAALGLNRWAIAELPTQPLLSLSELQHFDISYRNLSTPKVTNAIGNSHASPRLSPGDVLLDRGEGLGSVIGHDHSYVSNHILFDDWFFSSVTPEYEAFTQNEKRSIEEVYADHLSGEKPLSNSQYLPASSMDVSTASDKAIETLAKPDVWQNIAAEIEVEGMFNINSTSVAAWKALLLNQRNTEVPYTSNGVSTLDDWSVDLLSPLESPFSRTTVAGDPQSASDPEVALIATHMTMNEDEVEALATAIVEQVKKRGPFLSLSEFINRQVRNDDNELALAGAVEMALIELSKASTNNPYDEIKAAYPQQAILPSDSATIYEFTEAAEGDAVYGSPGWARQADVIRHLAPVMSARDDTFKIRAYGEAKDPVSGKVTAKSWCEAIVQRRADYVDPSNNSDDKTSLLSDENKSFGRRFEIMSFRWLTEEEI